MSTEATPSAKGAVETVELSRAEQTAARRAAESKATIPHLYLEAEADAGPWGGEASAPLGALAVVACSVALREFPRLNGGYRDGRIELYSRINIAVTIATPAPTIFDADAKAAADVASEIEALRVRAAEGALTARESAGATFTVDDLTGTAATRAFGVVVPGQSAALCVTGGGGGAAVRLGLSCDHRVVGTGAAAEFLGRVKAAIERPPAR